MDSEEKRNYLRISSEAFSLELEGDPNFILETYDNVREDVLRRLIKLLQEAPATIPRPQSAPTEHLDLPVADPPHDPHESSRIRAANAKNYVWVYVTHEIYNKVYVVDLPNFMTSPFSRFLDGQRLRKMYINREHRDLLGPLLETGKTLWSELTEKGREQLGGNE